MASFINASTHSMGWGRDFGVMRSNVAALAERWQSELSPADQARILAIAAQFEVGRGYLG